MTGWLPARAGITVNPPQVELAGNFARAQLIITQTESDGTVHERSLDLSRAATYVSSNPQVVAATEGGRLLATGDGEATITINHGADTAQVQVRVTGVLPAPKVGFARDILPVLSKGGCNSGACHASQYGKGGFKLTVFSFSPGDDYSAIVRDRQGRRINRIEPPKSLLILKPTLGVPHGGNQRIAPGSVDQQILEAWILGGMPGPAADDPKVSSIQVQPARRVGPASMTQQLRVVANYSDGTQRDVTHWTRFDSMDDSVLTVSSTGMVTAVGRGQATAMVRFGGQAEVATIIVPYADAIDLASWTENNFVDRLAADKFRELALAPSPLCDDATFLRRAFLDAIGSLPTVEESVAFLDSTDPNKRALLVDRLLGLTGDPAQDVYRNQYAAYWSLKWSDLLQSSSASIGEQSMWALYNWLQTSFRDNKPFDQFVRDLITARGSVYSNGPANYFRGANPSNLAERTSQVFLGIRLQCAQCHHHPFEKYGQDDYYGFAAFFARVGNKSSQEFGVFGGESIVLVNSGGEVGNPRTGQVMKPTPLEGEPAAERPDRRQALADWLVSKDNKFLARNIANRYVAYLLGRGLVEPIDDMRATNPASNAALLDALAKDFLDGNFDLKHLLRTIMNSRLYQLDSQPNASNATDSRFYSHYGVKRLAAEPLLDAIDQVSSVRTKFRNLPLGTRAIELPDAEYPDFFLKTFGKPKRGSVCECERSREANLAQALHTLNGDIVAGKISHADGRVAKLVASARPWQEGVTELYLATLCRRPSEQELATWRTFHDQIPDAKIFYEDLLWTLINSKQFLYVH